MHPYVHLELARIRQQELITKAERSRAAFARLNLDRVAEPGLRRRGTLAQARAVTRHRLLPRREWRYDSLTFEPVGKWLVWGRLELRYG